jgi:hypothetical protein
MTDGATAPVSQTKLSSAALLLPDYGQTSKAIWLATTLSGWHRSFFSSGGNLLDGVGGKELNWTMWREWMESSRFG